MGSLSGGVGGLLSSCTSFQFHSNHSPPCPKKVSPTRRHTQIPHPRIQTTMVSVLKSPPIASELEEDDILQTFIKERESSGDIVAKVSDILWLRKFIGVHSAEADVTPQLKETLGDKNEGGFLKLTRTLEWVAGDNSAPVNQKMIAKELQNDSERRKILNLLRYEALKREMLLLTVGIGTVCSGYCLVVFSVQAAVSYATGVLLSCLYLQLLCNHADNISKETVPQIFWQKKTKKIGIESQDFQKWFEMTVQGSGIALSSPRLVIPAAIYGVWGLSQHFNDLFDFQLAPAMIGMFAYKAAALVQVYRDNEELRTDFPDSGEGSSD